MEPLSSIVYFCEFDSSWLKLEKPPPLPPPSPPPPPPPPSPPPLPLLPFQGTCAIARSSAAREGEGEEEEEIVAWNQLVRKVAVLG
jgi:hypothetical protein